MTDTCDYKWRLGKRCGSDTSVIIEADPSGQPMGICSKHFLKMCEDDESLCVQAARKCEAEERDE